MLRTAAVATLGLLAAPALARPEVIAATPAAGAAVSAPERIGLTMSEPLVARSSGGALTMTAMPGMADHPPMAIAVRSGIGPDGRTLTLTPARKLVPGSYVIAWHATSADAQPASGTHAFTVR